MKRFIVAILIGAALLACSCQGGGGVLQKKTDSPDNNRVIGMKTSAVAASKTEAAKTSTAPASSAPASLAPVISQQSGVTGDENNAPIKLNLRWNVTVEGDNAKVDCELYLNCYALSTKSGKKGSITVNGSTENFVSSAIDQPQNVLTEVYLHSCSFTVPLESVPAEGIKISAQWDFKGTYSGVAIDSLTLEQTVFIGG
jgi:hypothetical protein